MLQKIILKRHLGRRALAFKGLVNEMYFPWSASPNHWPLKSGGNTLTNSPKSLTRSISGSGTSSTALIIFFKSTRVSKRALEAEVSGGERILATHVHRSTVHFLHYLSNPRDPVLVQYVIIACISFHLHGLTLS